MSWYIYKLLSLIFINWLLKQNINFMRMHTHYNIKYKNTLHFIIKRPFFTLKRTNSKQVTNSSIYFWRSVLRFLKGYWLLWNMIKIQYKIILCFIRNKIGIRITFCILEQRSYLYYILISRIRLLDVYFMHKMHKCNWLKMMLAQY